MGDGTAIQWADASWNPIVGCSIKSAGCIRCYAMKDAYRFGFNPKVPHYHGLTKMVNGNPVWTGEVAAAPDRTWEMPLRWNRPRTIFVNSMGDLHHEEIPVEWIDRAYSVMVAAWWHRFLVLTKRPELQREYLADPETPLRIARLVYGDGHEARHTRNSPDQPGLLLYTGGGELGTSRLTVRGWPAPNVWTGTSIEDQRSADDRLGHLIDTPSALRWISAEPFLSPRPIKLPLALGPGDDGKDIVWVVVGGESGKGARPFWLDAARETIAQCREAGAAVFVKQLGSCPMGSGGQLWLDHKKGGDMAEWPEDLRLREFPI